MKKYLFFVFAVSIWSYAEQWSLEKSVEHALKHSKTLRSHIQDMVSDSARVIQAKGVFYPNLSASASTSVYNTPFANPSDPNGTVSMGLSSRLVLFDGRRNSNNLSIAVKNLEKDKFLLKNTEKDIVSLTTRNYISVLYATEALKNAGEAVLLAQKQFEYQQALSEVGKATPLALSRSNAQLSKNKYSETIALNTLNLAILQIKQLLELDSNIDFEIVYPDTSFEEIADLSADSIFNNNSFSEINLAQILVETAQISLQTAQAAKSPTLSANGSISTRMESSSPQSGNKQLQDRISPSLGLSLDVPIVDNRSAKTSVIIAKSDLNKAKISLETTRQDVYSQIEQLVSDIKAAAARFASAKEQFWAETENMNTVEEMHGIGNITMIDYASQQNDFISAQSELTQAKYSLMLSQKLLEIYLGN